MFSVGTMPSIIAKNGRSRSTLVPMADTYAQRLEEDLSRLRKMLDRVLEPDEERVRQALARREEARILNLACGAANEAETLAEFVLGLQEGTGRRVKLTGIDLRPREIADARRRFGGARKDPEREVEKEFEFVAGDATRLDGHRELGGPFDLVFLRHQNCWNGPRTWEEIFDRALERLDDDGRLIITSYFDREHEMALEAIEKLGGNLVRSEANPESRRLPTPGKSVDRHVAVFRRRDS